MKIKISICGLFFSIITQANSGDVRLVCAPCNATDRVARFCNVAVNNNLCVNNSAQILGDLTVCGTINGGTGCLCACPLFGNVIRVDKVYGTPNGTRNGCPFLTINQALAVALPGDTVWVFPGTYEEAIIVPDGVSIRGLSRENVIIGQSNVTQDTDLVTMGENAVLEDLVFNLTSSEHVQLRAIVFPGTTTLTSEVRLCKIIVDNSAAGAGSSNVYGIHAIGSSGPIPIVQSTMFICKITVNSTGGGAKRGILIDSANNDFHFRDTNVATIGGTDSIALETNNPTASCDSRYNLLAGDTADISQTAGTIKLLASELYHSNANGLGFVTEIDPNSLVWADPGSLPGGTSYMRPGTASVSPYIINLRVSQKLVIKSLNIRAQFPPGGSVIDTWTLVRNGVNTPLVVTLTGSQTTNINDSISVHYDLGDDIALRLDRAPTSGTVDIIAIMDLY